MRSVERRTLTSILMAVTAIAQCGAQVAKAAVPSAWEQRNFTMYYFGFTSLYTCDGLEDRVRQILVYLGARKDMTVHARGCTVGSNEPSRSAWVDAQFYSLQPTADSATPGGVNGEWKSVELSPHHPNFMQDGDCELVERMKESTLKNFSMRNVDYHASCVPGEVRIASYAVRAQVLESAATGGMPTPHDSAGN